MLRLRGVTLLLAAVLLSAAACGGIPDQRGDHRLRVAVSVAPQAYFVERIGGDRVSVTVMIPPGFSHVDYPLTPRRMMALADADLYVKVGHPAFDYEWRYIDPWLRRAPHVRVVDMSRGMRLLPGQEGEETHGHADHGHSDHDHGDGDPHVWVAPDTVAVAARNIAHALEEADPAGAPVYRAGLRSFLEEIAALDREIRAELAGTGAGAGGRKFLVYHPDWGYFARQYGLEQISIEAEGKEPSAARMIGLIDRARREGVRLVLIQGGFPRKSAQVIADAVHGRVVVADPQEKDWPDNLRRVAAAFRETSPHG